MRFSSLALENWRNFRTVSVELQDRAFLVGPNASGKSNFLDAFRFLRDIASLGSGGFQKAVDSRGGVSRIRCLAAKRYSDVSIEVGLVDNDESRWRYRLAFYQDKQQRPMVKTEEVWKDDTLLLQRPDPEDEADPERRLLTNLEQVSANREFRKIAEFFSSVSYYHIVPQLVRDPGRYVGRQGDPFGGDFLEQIARTDKKTRDSRLDRIAKALKVTVPQLSELDLRIDDRGTPHIYGRYQHWRPQGAWQSEADFSDGTLRLMGLLWALLDGGGPILLEEPELSLHPEVVQHIPQLLTRVQRKRPRRQVLMSTHSHELLKDEGIGADEVFLFTPSANGTKVASSAGMEEIRTLLESGLSMADIALARTKPPEAVQLSLFGE